MRTAHKGGSGIETGVDLDGDAELDATEIADTALVCVSLDLLQETSVEPAGDNCEEGGQRIDVGPDLDGNEVLDDDEIVATLYACDASANDVLSQGRRRATRRELRQRRPTRRIGPGPR